jgi:hypothetical protein
MPQVARGYYTPHDDNTESRTLLPTRQVGHWEGAEHLETEVGVRAPIQPGDESIPSERNVWRHFESYKRSAILHTEQYLQHNAALRFEESATVDLDSLERGEHKLHAIVFIAMDSALTVIQ